MSHNEIGMSVQKITSRVFYQRKCPKAIKYLNSKNYNPKKYNLTISNTKKIEQTIEIKNLTTKLTEKDLNSIIDGIIKQDKNIIKKYNIDYQYTN